MFSLRIANRLMSASGRSTAQSSGAAIAQLKQARSKGTP
jgi:hypothetical protein